MKAEKVIKPANGYLMLLIVLLLFVTGIVATATLGKPVFYLQP